MQVKKKLSGTLYVPILIFIVTLITGCNNDVFIDRPDIIVSSRNIHAGESATIKANFKLDSYPYMTIYYHYGAEDQITLYTGKNYQYSDELLEIKTSVNVEETSLTMNVVKNYYPDDIKVIFSVREHQTYDEAINIITTARATFYPGEMEYTFNSWSTNIRNVVIPVTEDSFKNPIDDSSVKFPIINSSTTCNQIGVFKPNNPILNLLLQQESYNVPVAAFTDRLFPEITDQIVTYDTRFESEPFTINAYPLQSTTSTIVSIKPGGTLHYKIEAEAEICSIRYSLPIFNNEGVSFTITGDLMIAVPKRFLSQYNITD